MNKLTLKYLKTYRLNLLTTHHAFTMAEILLSLTIIGVVAAITLPSLTGNINERTWNTQRKALYARMSQAIALMPSLNGYGTLTETTDESGSKSITADTAAETFITEGLAKVLKINNICDSEHIMDCGFSKKITRQGIGKTKRVLPVSLVKLNPYFNYKNDFVNYSQINTKAVAFETKNGESILLFYNPYCKPYSTQTYRYFQPYMCANFVYDLNGKRGPNTVGKDIGFMTAFYSTDTILVAPNPAGILRLRNSGNVNFGSACRETFGENTYYANIEELLSVFTNNYLGTLKNSDGVIGNYYMWANSFVSSTKSIPNKLVKFSAYETMVYYSDLNINANYHDIFCLKRF